MYIDQNEGLPHFDQRLINVSMELNNFLSHDSQQFYLARNIKSTFPNYMIGYTITGICKQQSAFPLNYYTLAFVHGQI